MLIGQVTGEGGEPLVGAQVHVFNEGAEVAVTATGLDGNYTFRSLPEGQYTVQFRYLGSVPQWVVVDLGEQQVGWSVVLQVDPEAEEPPHRRPGL